MFNRYKKDTTVAILGPKSAKPLIEKMLMGEETTLGVIKHHQGRSALQTDDTCLRLCIGRQSKATFEAPQDFCYLTKGEIFMLTNFMTAKGIRCEHKEAQPVYKAENPQRFTSTACLEVIEFPGYKHGDKSVLIDALSKACLSIPPQNNIPPQDEPATKRQKMTGNGKG